MVPMSSQVSHNASPQTSSELRPQVSVVVPYHGGLDDVSVCLQALLAQVTSRNFEVIAVDDGSPDSDTAERLMSGIGDDSRLVAIRQENMGPAAARNTGAARARGEYLLFTDADCRPEPVWLDSMCRGLDDGAAGTKGVYRTEQTSWVARLVQVEYEEKYAYMARFDSIDFIDTYAAGFRLDTFQKYGGFDERFRYPSVEDQEFSFRLSEGGEVMRFCPDAAVVHRHVESLWGYARKKMRIAFYKALILRLLPKRSRGDTHTPPTLMLQLPLVVGLAASIVFGILVWPPLAWLAPAALLLFVWTCRNTVRQAAQSAAGLRSVVPLLMLVRASALAAGLTAGLLRFHLGPLPRKPR